MKYLKIPTDFVHGISVLSDSEKGRLFTAMLMYAESRREPCLKGNERFLWPAARNFITREERIIAGRAKYGAVGEFHPNWKGGITPQNQKGRNSREYHEWRAAVFGRDKFICQCCGKRGGELNAHHIEPWADNPDKRYDVANGITLCVDCHKSAHKGAR